jgi:hypothetical protein
MFPSEHKADHGRFMGTLCSALDLVWFTEEDHASKSNYADWAGSIDELPVPGFGIHKYINDIVPGYYVKIDSSETKKGEEVRGAVHLPPVQERRRRAGDDRARDRREREVR